jgi:hypothetical protein
MQAQKELEESSFVKRSDIRAINFYGQTRDFKDKKIARAFGRGILRPKEQIEVKPKEQSRDELGQQNSVNRNFAVSPTLKDPKNKMTIRPKSINDSLLKDGQEKGGPELV